MEQKQQEISVLQSSFLYRLFTWDHKPLVQYSSLALINLFFYLYILRGFPLISILSLAALFTILFRFIVAPDMKSNEAEWITEEYAKELYIAVYVGLNRFVQYMRSIIQVKGGMKAVAVSWDLHNQEHSLTLLLVFAILESSCLYVHLPSD